MIKSFTSEITSLLRSRRGRGNLRVLIRFILILIVMISVFSIGFHMLMMREGQEFSWITGFYWTLTVMSTLGFGDITFHTDIGRLFSIIVLLSGLVFFLILLPFTFIEFFYAPWMNAQATARAPRQLPVGTHDHVLLTNYNAVTSALVRRLEHYKYAYAMLVPDLEEALRFHDIGLNVVVGNLDDPEAWKRLRVESAALVVSTDSDIKNTNISFTVRALAKKVPIITSAVQEDSVDILKLAGSNVVLRLEKMMGQSFALRTLGGNTRSHIIGGFDKLQIAEATTNRTPLVGKTIRDSKLREDFGVTIVGVWERGQFESARLDTVINDNTVLLLAGLKESLKLYDENFRKYSAVAAPVIILGGGRVGQATAKALSERGLDYWIVETRPGIAGKSDRVIQGNAADLQILEKAGIQKSSTVIITPRDDDLNIYLTMYCRRLRPDIQILSRATHERNVATIHRAGADSVLSYASMGASAAMNLLKGNKILMVAEGLDLFTVRVPPDLAGRTIAESSIRERTGCSVVAIQTATGTEVVPNPTQILPVEAEIVLIGSVEAQNIFLGIYMKQKPTPDQVG